jgi:1-deoxy-D-xylulose-5-phosphate synthase
MLYTGHLHQGPAAVRYPRGGADNTPVNSEMTAMEIGKARVIREGKKVAILNFGSLLCKAAPVAEQLDATLVDMRFVKPLDEACIKTLAAEHDVLVTLEENAIQGGAGSAVNEFLFAQQLNQVKVLNIGLPDNFVEQGSQEQIYDLLGLDSKGIQQKIENFCQA